MMRHTRVILALALPIFISTPCWAEATGTGDSGSWELKYGTPSLEDALRFASFDLHFEISPYHRPDEVMTSHNDFGGPHMIFRRARGTPDAPEAVTAENNLGGISGTGYD